MQVSPLSRDLCRQRRIPRREDVRGPYFRDQTAIIHDTSFRRLKHKTQVFFNPENDHICTRIEHVLHVATVAATLCRGLAREGWEVDPEMAYAAGLGHDLGHAPFGHSGERAISALLGEGAFIHEVHSLRVVDTLARDGRGLNLTRGVRDGILCHNGERFEQYLAPESQPRPPEEKTGRDRLPATWEGCAVRFADKISYLGRDLEDALTAGFLTRADIPPVILKELGDSNGEIINTLVIDIIEHATATGRLGLSDDRYDVFRRLRDFNTRYIYQHDRILEYEKYCYRIIGWLFDYLLDRFAADGGLEPPPASLDPARESLPLNRSFAQYRAAMAPLYRQEGAPPERIVTDYVAGMTDSFALSAIRQITMPEPIAFFGRHPRL